MLPEVFILGRHDRDPERFRNGREGERPAAHLPELRDQPIIAGVHPEGYVERDVAQRLGGRKLGNELDPHDEDGGEDGDEPVPAMRDRMNRTRRIRRTPLPGGALWRKPGIFADLGERRGVVSCRPVYRRGCGPGTRRDGPGPGSTRVPEVGTERRTSSGGHPLGARASCPRGVGGAGRGTPPGDRRISRSTRVRVMGRLLGAHHTGQMTCYYTGQTICS